MDNDSNYSAESFKRKMQMEKDEVRSKKRSTLRTDLLNSEIDDGDRKSLIATQEGVSKSNLSGKLSKVSEARRTQDQLLAVPSEKSLQIKGNLKKKPKFMNDPLKQVKLKDGVLMRNETGLPLGVAKPFSRDTSKQLTILEYASMKNSETAKSRLDGFLMNRSQASVSFDDKSNQPINNTRIKPDSAQQLDDAHYIATQDQMGGGGSRIRSLFLDPTSADNSQQSLPENKNDSKIFRRNRASLPKI